MLSADMVAYLRLWARPTIQLLLWGLLWGETENSNSPGNFITKSLKADLRTCKQIEFRIVYGRWRCKRPSPDIALRTEFVRQSFRPKALVLTVVLSISFWRYAFISAFLSNIASPG